MKTSKGFTIIELLVVIAIIAVLAAVVMVNVTGYINKGKDAAIQANLASVMTNAAVAIDGGAVDVCTNAVIVDALEQANLAYNNTTTGETKCNDAATTDTAWAACSALKNVDDYFCVDSTGKKTATGAAADCVAGWVLTACP